MRILVLLSLILVLAACAAPAPAPTQAPITTNAPVAAPTRAEGTTNAPPPTSRAAFTMPALTPTPSIVSTNDTPTPLVLSLATQPRGLTAVNNFEPRTQAGSLFDGSLFDDRTYANPNVAGLTFRTSWADIEPTKGNFVWAKLDTVFDNAEKNSRWVELVLIPGFGTPVWALQGVQTATFSVIYGPGKGENLLLPLPWDQVYLNRWFAFLKAVSARYQNRPSFIKIAADGPTSVTAEMSLPNAPADLCTWVKVGYTSDRLIGAWKQVFANYAQIFRRQYFSLALYPPLPIVSTTRCENGNPTGIAHNESQRVTAVIVGLGADNYPKQFVLQENGMTAAKDNTSISGAYDIVKSYSGKVVIGFQLVTSAILHPSDMGDLDGATALQKSLQRGVDANAQFLEVWEPDVLAPAAQNVLAATARALAH
jgi:Beta-galactosidase